MGRFSNEVILLFHIRYLNNLKEEPIIEEIVISPTHIYYRPTGKITGSGILEMLKTQNIDIKNCRTQGLQSAMVKAKEASAVTKGQQPMADSIHCRNHYINLAIAFAVKNKNCE